jgi:hypothetical protein
MKRLRACIVILLLVGLGSCASPPQAEIDAARKALDAAALDADVITYAPDSLRAAREKLAALEAEVAAQARRSALSRRYEAAKTLAEEAAAMARKAGDEAAAEKRQTAVEAAGLVDEVTAAINAFESKLWAAKRVPRIKLAVIAPLQALPGQARAAVADAQKDIQSQAFATAKAKLLAVKTQLSEAAQTITEQTRMARAR